MSTLLSPHLLVDQAPRHLFASSTNTAQRKNYLSLWNLNRWQVSTIQHFSITNHRQSKKKRTIQSAIKHFVEHLADDIGKSCTIRFDDKGQTFTSPNLDPQASLSPQKTHESHKQGPSLPLHITLHALQHSYDELNLKSVPHFTAGPQSSRLSIPRQHSPTTWSRGSSVNRTAESTSVRSWDGRRTVEKTA